MKHVLVTGANGHVGNNLVRLLLEQGYTVRASVRDKSDPAKTRPLSELGCEIVEADIMEPDTLHAAVDGLDGVFHVAAVYVTWAKDPQREIIDPSVKGATNVLSAAADAGVKRVVLTSSCAAVGVDAPAGEPLTEDDWYEDAVNPYMYAKTVAERTAWELAEERGLDLRAINPSGIIGPGFWRHTPSTEIFEQLLRGSLPMLPPLGFAYVDVRDVARAHLLVYERDEAEGRYITSTRFTPATELVELLGRLYPDLKLPSKALPKAILPLVAAGDWLTHSLTGRPRQLTMAMIDEFVGKEQRVSNAKLRGLGWEPTDFDQTLRDTVEWTRKTFIEG